MKILIVDDELNMIKTLGAVLRREGFEIRGVGSAEEALTVLGAEPVDLMISDVKMPGLSGHDLLQKVRETGLNVPVIMMTAYGTIEDAVSAMRQGASDYVTKPFHMEEIKIKIHRLLEMTRLRDSHQRLSRENTLLREQLDARLGSGGPVSTDPRMTAIWETVRKVADQRSTVLITGESGTGKEVVARTIHAQSHRHAGPFVPVHCAALSPTLLESELFGHEKGAFTGAIRQKTGRFELADQGTIFLDEVGEIPLELQVKLLRVLQTHELERVGGEKTMTVDVRVVAATNRDLMKMIQDGGFREDLYYRLNVIHIHVPPLRERTGDILPLAGHFLARMGAETGRKFTAITADARNALLKYAWPGNVRELENVIERAVVLETGDRITHRFLSIPTAGTPPEDGLWTAAISAPGKLARSESDLIRQTLVQCRGSKADAARALGIGRTTLWRKLKKYGLE